MELGIIGLGKMGFNMAERLRLAGHKVVGFDDLEAYVTDSGEVRWTVLEAIDLNVSSPVISKSVIRRLRSREQKNFTDRMLAVMRNEFGGHAVKTA